MNLVAEAPSPVDARTAHAWAVLDTVLDPEVPVVSVCELGIVRDVRCDAHGTTVMLTPTYSGCPATEFIERGVVDALVAAGFGPVRVQMQRAPAWTTDWISAEGRRKLRAYGIAPPGPVDTAHGVTMRFVPQAMQRYVALHAVEPKADRRSVFMLSQRGQARCAAFARGTKRIVTPCAASTGPGGAMP